jgi:Tfp pilus assembly protein PilN
MINLLPPEQKEETFLRERLTLVLILGILFFSFLISLSLILFSTKIALLGNLEVQRTSLEESEREISFNQEIKEIIKNSNLTFSKLDSFYQKRLDLTRVLEKISKLLPPGTYLTNFNFNLSQKKENFRAQISLSGFSESREVLLSFKENMGKEAEFAEVYFPPENWVKPSDINFTVTFKLK